MGWLRGGGNGRRGLRCALAAILRGGLPMLALDTLARLTASGDALHVECGGVLFLGHEINTAEGKGTGKG